MSCKLGQESRRRGTSAGAWESGETHCSEGIRCREAGKHSGESGLQAVLRGLGNLSDTLPGSFQTRTGKLLHCAETSKLGQESRRRGNLH